LCFSRLQGILYYLIEIERFPDEVKNALDEWIYFFKHSEIPDEFRAKHIQSARQKLDLMQMSAEERRAYDRFWMARASYQDEIQSAQKKGREEGREEGLVAKQYEIARQMLQHGESIDKIELYTGLSEAEIRQQQ
jgi:predicted transposase/invertase (TIGR01784 family)